VTDPRKNCSIEFSHTLSLQEPMTLENRFRAHSTRIWLAAVFDAMRQEVKKGRDSGRSLDTVFQD
jgi:hypothetical protein